MTSVGTECLGAKQKAQEHAARMRRLTLLRIKVRKQGQQKPETKTQK